MKYSPGLMSEPLVVMDFETTGLSPGSCRITEVAALKMVEGQIVERFVTLVNCGVAVPAEVSALTGITTAMVRSAPAAEDVLPALHAFIGSCPVVAHNAHFDQSFFEHELRRQDLASRSDPFICTVRVARRVIPGLPSYRLSALAGHCRISFRSSAHRAQADAEVTAAVLMHLAARLAALGIRDVSPQLLARLMRCRISDAMGVLEREMREQPE